MELAVFEARHAPATREEGPLRKQDQHGRMLGFRAGGAKDLRGATIVAGEPRHARACRTGFGAHRCLRAAAAFARRHAWVLRLDLAKFFPSIDHAVLRGMLRPRTRHMEEDHRFGHDGTAEARQVTSPEAPASRTS
ncbi:hypothetical protein [Sorangium sp. So ce542]|uniref:hypothetical protein n=1 Tax=Sorangium sp. So ce542 TaxID=3133316 RepID=UPI003F5FA96C